MGFRLEIGLRGSATRPRSVSLSRGRTRVGGALRNDLILLDRGVPARAGEFRASLGRLAWVPLGSDAPVDALRRAVCVGPYEIRAKRVPSLADLSAAFAGLLVCALGWDSVDPRARPGRTGPQTPASVALPARGIYGPLSPGGGTARVRFEFEADGTSALTLHYSAAYVRSAEDLAVELNGRGIGYVAPCPGGWAVEERLTLPRERLRPGSNRLEFRGRAGGGPAAAWGVKDLYVTRVRNENAPADDPELLFAAAEKLFRLWTARPGQLVRARQLLGRAVSVWRAEKGSVPPEALRLKFEMAKAESEMIARALAEAKGALGLGNRRGAGRIYDRLLAELVEPDDPRRREIERARKEAGP